MAAANEKRTSLDEQGSASQYVAGMSSNPSEKDGDPPNGEELPKPSPFSAPAMEAYGMVLQEGLKGFHSYTEKLYGGLDAMERQEEVYLAEILVKTAESTQLTEHMRNQREAAATAISQLTGHFCNKS